MYVSYVSVGLSAELRHRAYNGLALLYMTWCVSRPQRTYSGLTLTGVSVGLNVELCQGPYNSLALLYMHFCCRYGVREFVVISPGANCEAIISESKCNLLLSSVSIALGNTGW